MNEFKQLFTPAILHPLHHPGDSSRLTALSLSNCNLSDDDVSVLFAQVGPQVRLETLNLSVNRIADAGIAVLVDQLIEMQKEENTLQELNLANNRVSERLKVDAE